MTLAWQPDYLREECESDAELDAREDLCFHGIPKDGTCIDCKEEAADDPDFNNDYGFPR